MVTTRASSLELLSIHIPKTAGTSFRKVLEGRYGDDLKTYYGDEATLALWRGEPLVLDVNVRATHGHIKARSDFREQYPDAKLVTWVRDPVDRLISYFYFWKQLERHGNPCHNRFLDNDLSLVEFAQQDYMKEEMSQYFGDVSPLDFDFVGIVEEYETEIQRFAQLMDWETLPVEAANRTVSKPDVSAAQRQEIARELEADVAMYRELRG